MRLTLFLDHNCNLRCRYCYSGRKYSSPMSLDTARRALEFAVAYRPPLTQINFFGGEPFLAFELMDAVVHLVGGLTASQPRRPVIVVTTNATLLSDDAVAWLLANHLHVVVSIDGTQEAHDSGRIFPDGRGSYAETVAGVQRLVAADLPLKANAVVDPANVRWLAPSAAHLYGLGLKDITFSPNYSAVWSESTLDKLAAQLDTLAVWYGDRFRAGQAPVVDPLDTKIRSHVHRDCPWTQRCSFGCDELAVAPSGRIYPCGRLVADDTDGKMVIGTLERGQDVARRDALVTQKDALLDDCAACGIVDRCMHACGCVNFATTGELGLVCGLVCRCERMFVATADRMATALFDEQNQQFLARFYGLSS